MGRVKVQAMRGRLRLVFSYGPRGNSTRVFKSLGLLDDALGRAIASSKAAQIEVDLATNNFDPTLEKYDLAGTEGPVTVPGLFQQFMDHKSRSVAARTLEKYQALLVILEERLRKPAAAIGEADAELFKSYLLLRLGMEPVTAAERIGLLRSCWRWAMKRELIPVVISPWDGVTVKVPPKEAPKPFTAAEAGQIVEAFRDGPPGVAHYAAMVEFWMETGCRTGELRALQWKRVESDCSSVWIGESLTGKGERVAAQRNRARTLNLTGRAAELLRELRPQSPDPESFVFTAIEGGPVCARYFSRRIWKPVLSGLKIPYRRPYNNRHTVVSHNLVAGVDEAQICDQVGTSIKMLRSRYAGVTVDKPQLRSWRGDSPNP